MKKAVVFIGATSRSGSSLLERLIARETHGMALGEINALFYPFRKHHFEMLEKVTQKGSWTRILEGDSKGLYARLFQEFPNQQVFIDSSKNPFWIQSQVDALKRLDVKVVHLLIYKSPLELAKSYAKRYNQSGWAEMSLAYHLKYLNMISGAIFIPYKSIVLQSTVLRKITEFIGQGDVQYHDEHDVVPFFGSKSVKGGVSSLQYDDDFSYELRRQVDERLAKDPLLHTLYEYLDEFAGSNEPTAQPQLPSDLVRSVIWIQFKRFIWKSKRLIGRWRPTNYDA